jgi:hypothetical protein
MMAGMRSRYNSAAAPWQAPAATVPSPLVREGQDEGSFMQIQNVGYDALTRTLGIIAPGETILLYGPRPVYRVSLFMLKQVLKRIGSVAIVDGANRFEPYRLARLAQIEGHDPSEILDCVYLSRVFTCFQMEGVLTRGAERFLQDIQSRALFVFGLLHTFYDDQISTREAEKSLARIRAHFEAMNRNGISILLTSEILVPQNQERRHFFERLLTFASRAYCLDDQRLQAVPLPGAASRTRPPSLQSGTANVHQFSVNEKRREYGTHVADVYHGYPGAGGAVEKVPRRAPQGRPGSV